MLNFGDFTAVNNTDIPKITIKTSQYENSKWRSSKRERYYLSKVLISENNGLYREPKSYYKPLFRSRNINQYDDKLFITWLDTVDSLIASTSPHARVRVQF